MAEEENGILLLFILFVGLFIVTASLYITQAGLEFREVCLPLQVLQAYTTKPG